MNSLQLRTFAIGYYHGRTSGTERSLYQDDSLQHLYRLGFEAGVADYVDGRDEEDQGEPA